MSAADRLEDSFPHGTVDGFKAGCRGVICPAGAEHGLSCQRAKQLAAGDYQYQKLARRGASPAEISEALGLHPQIHRAAPKKVAVPDDEFKIDEPEEAPMEAVKVPTPKDVAPKPKTVQKPTPAPTPKPKATPAPKPKRKPLDGPSQSEVRAWARENGLDVNPRGQVRADVVRAYLAAHAPILSKPKDAPTASTVEDVPMVPVTAPFVGARGWLKHDDGIAVVREVIATGRELTVKVSWLPDPRADEETWASWLAETSGPFPADDFTFDTFPGMPPVALNDEPDFLYEPKADEVDVLLQVGTAATVSVEEARENLGMRREFTSPPEQAPVTLAEFADVPCENLTQGSCADEGSGRSPVSPYGATGYCWPCRIRHALRFDEVLVEGSWFKRAELPMILGNYMRTAEDFARQVKDITIAGAELAPAPEADAAAYAALELVLRKWAAEKDRADALQRALDDERERLGSFARMLSSYQEAATADGEHIASLDEQIRDLTDKVALLSIPWWRRAS